MKRTIKVSKVPNSFRPLLWSYDIARLDLRRDRRTIIVSTLNNGTWAQWRWIKKHYGLPELQRIVASTPATAFRAPVRRLISLILNVDPYANSPRGSYPRR